MAWADVFEELVAYLPTTIPSSRGTDHFKNSSIYVRNPVRTLAQFSDISFRFHIGGFTQKKSNP